MPIDDTNAPPPVTKPPLVTKLAPVTKPAPEDIKSQLPEFPPNRKIREGD